MELVKIPIQIQHNRLPLMGEFYCLLNEAIRILELRYVLHKIRSGFLETRTNEIVFMGSS